MIATLTPNPAIDQTISIGELRVGEVHRVRESQLDPAGKGINVSRFVDRLGWPTIAFGFLAGEIGLLVARALADEGIHSHFLEVPGQTRLNVMIFDAASGSNTSFYEPGPPVRAEHERGLRQMLAPWLPVSRVLVLAGSLPPGLPEDFYARWIGEAREHGAMTILDADGPPFRLGLHARPYLVKPNLAEAERVLRQRLPDLPSVVDAARELQQRGAEVAVVSLGAEGAVCAEGDRVWQAIPPRVERRSTVGSGDSMVAGLAIGIASGDGLVEGLRLGTAAGAATAMMPGTALGPPGEVAKLLQRVQIRQLAGPPVELARTRLGGWTAPQVGRGRPSGVVSR